MWINCNDWCNLVFDLLLWLFHFLPSLLTHSIHVTIEATPPLSMQTPLSKHAANESESQSHSTLYRGQPPAMARPGSIKCRVDESLGATLPLSSPATQVVTD